MVRYSAAVIDGDKITETFSRLIDPNRCPHFILTAEHYREDGSCKCNDPNETVMAEWGYVWRKGQWRV